jgi:hypothetical protein
LLPSADEATDHNPPGALVSGTQFWAGALSAIKAAPPKKSIAAIILFSSFITLIMLREPFSKIGAKHFSTAAIKFNSGLARSR